MSNLFMVDFSLPKEYPQEFWDHLQYQQVVVQKYFSEGKLLNYALAMDQSKMWAIFSAESIKDVGELVLAFPLSKFIDFKIFKLDQYNIHQVIPQFSLN